MIERAPSRSALPTQSAPVSPPPITTTSLPAAVISRPAGGCGVRRLGAELARRPAVALVEVVHREVHAVELAAGHGQVARDAGARREHDRVEARAQLLGVDVAADVDAAAQLDALRGELLDAPLDDHFSILKSGTPKRTRPPIASSRSNSVTRVARAAQLLRGRHPRRPGADDGDPLAGLAPRRARASPSPPPTARSMIAFSICLIVTASPSRISSTHAASHGAGQSRPVNSGKLFVACSCAIASRQAVAVDEVVPVGDEVPERAAVVAEGDAAVHAARALVAQLGDGALHQELAVVVSALAPGPCRGLRGARSAGSRRACPSGARLADRVERAPRGERAVRASRLGERLFLGELPQHALVVVGHHLHERAPLRAAPPTRAARARRPASPCAGRALRSARAARSRRPRRALRSPPSPCCSAPGSCRPRRARRRRRRSCPPRSCARCGPSTTTRPPVMYSQPWSPTPSTTALAPELRTAKRSPARPRKNARPAVAPYSTVLPTITFSSAPEVLAHALARADREDAAGEALAGVVLGVAAQRERDPGRQPAARSSGRPSPRSRPRSSPPAGPRRRGARRCGSRGSRRRSGCGCGSPSRSTRARRSVERGPRLARAAASRARRRAPPAAVRRGGAARPRAARCA